MDTIKIDGIEYQIDTDKALELGVLKETDPYHSWKVTSWDEYGAEIKHLTGNYPVWWGMHTIPESDAFIALGQLLHLRDAWWGEWEPDWNSTETKYTIVNDKGCPSINTAVLNSRILAFPKQSMAEAFYTTHKDLILKAKMFL